jgi:deoxyhypusine synthase
MYVHNVYVISVILLLQLEGVTAKMRSAGLCEMIVSTVQRQAISPVVSAHGCLAVGGLASDMGNQARLSAAGACEV